MDDDDDADDDDEPFNGLATAEHWLAMDTESVYVCEDLEVDPTDVVPMRVPPDPDCDVRTSESWFFASASPTTDAEYVEVHFPYYWSPVFSDLDRQAVEGEVVSLRFLLGLELKESGD